MGQVLQQGYCGVESQWRWKIGVNNELAEIRENSESDRV